MSSSADPQPIAAIYRDHQGWLRGWLHRKLGCHERAADLTHDTFLRLLTQDELEQIKSPRAYLLVVAKRVLVDSWRRERIERAYLEALANMPNFHAPDPQEQHLMLETLLEIDRRLAGLPVVVKRVFIHAQLGGLKQRQIADRLGISLSSVKRYLSRAYERVYFNLNAPL